MLVESVDIFRHVLQHFLQIRPFIFFLAHDFLDLRGHFTIAAKLIPDIAYIPLPLFLDSFVVPVGTVDIVIEDVLFLLFPESTHFALHIVRADPHLLG